MPHRTLPRIVLLISVILIVAGCAHRWRSSNVRVEAPGFDPRMDVFVDVENLAGSVRVQADPKVREVLLDARPPHATMWESECTPATVDARVVMEDGRAVLRIRALAPEGKPGPAFAGLGVRVPKIRGVRVRNAGGGVTVVGTSGTLEIVNDPVQLGRPGVGPVLTGPVLVTTSYPLTDAITIMNSRGPVSVECGEGSTGQFDLEALDGRVAVDSPAGSTKVARSSAGMWRGVIGRDSNRVLIRTTEGEISYTIK